VHLRSISPNRGQTRSGKVVCADLRWCANHSCGAWFVEKSKSVGLRWIVFYRGR
jgi:predicted RNA-binding Zn ribbon-like protein